MPRFHFNIFNGMSVPDDDGSMLRDASEAREAAIDLAGQMIREDAKRLSTCSDWRMEVSDAIGVVLYRLDFTVTENHRIE